MNGSWNDFLSNARALTSMYTDAPSFLELHELTLHREGPRLDLRIQLDRFPDKAPKKWMEAQPNRLQVLLRLSGITDFAITGWSTSNSIMSATFTGSPHEFSFVLTSSFSTLAGRAVDMQLAQFLPYREETL
jgi:hypothetical protein